MHYWFLTRCSLFSVGGGVSLATFLQLSFSCESLAVETFFTFRSWSQRGSTYAILGKCPFSRKNKFKLNSNLQSGAELFRRSVSKPFRWWGAISGSTCPNVSKFSPLVLSLANFEFSLLSCDHTRDCNLFKGRCRRRKGGRRRRFPITNVFSNKNVSQRMLTFEAAMGCLVVSSSKHSCRCEACSCLTDARELNPCCVKPENRTDTSREDEHGQTTTSALQMAFEYKDSLPLRSVGRPSTRDTNCSSSSVCPNGPSFYNHWRPF